MAADGSYTYTLDNASRAVQSLAAGKTVTETFNYQATDGLTVTPFALTITIAGTNDAPIAVADTAFVPTSRTLSCPAHPPLSAPTTPSTTCCAAMLPTTL